MRTARVANGRRVLFTKVGHFDDQHARAFLSQPTCGRPTNTISAASHNGDFSSQRGHLSAPTEARLSVTQPASERTNCRRMRETTAARSARCDARAPAAAPRRARPGMHAAAATTRRERTLKRPIAMLACSTVTSSMASWLGLFAMY